MLHQISYMSEMRFIPTPDAIGLIRDVSVRNNARDSVTGLLLVDHWRFIQALEGGEAEVRRTMDRIQADERHARISILSDTAVSCRQFGEWHMDVRNPDDGQDATSYMAQIAETVHMVEDMALRAMFLGFARLTAIRFSGR